MIPAVDERSCVF